MGISGTAAVQQELKELAKQLPALFDHIVSDLRSSKLQAVLHYYQHFTRYAHSSQSGQAATSTHQQQADALPEVLPVLTEIRECRTAPMQGMSAADTANNNAATTAPSIDWGLGDAGAGEPSGGVVDWGISSTADQGANEAGGISWDLGDMAVASGEEGAGGEAAVAAAGISWDVVLDPSTEGAAAAEGPAAAEAGAGPSLNWDIDLSGIDMEEAGQDATEGPSGIDWDVDTSAGAADKSGTAGTMAAAPGAAGMESSSDASASRLQFDSDYRSQLLDDLQELRAFLVSRKAGLSGSSSSQDLLRALAPDVVASTDAKDVVQMLQLVEELLAQLNANKLRQLLMIASSSR